MKDTLPFFLKHLPKDVFNTLQKVTSHRGEHIYTEEDEKIYFLLEGRAVLIRYDGSKENFYPYIFNKGDYVGISSFLTSEKNNWDIKIISKSANLLIISSKITNKYILPNPTLLIDFIKKGFDILNRGSISYRIKAQGGIIPLFSYLIIKNSTNGKFSFYSNSNLSKLMGVSRNTFYETVKTFEEKKLIIKKRNEITILNDQKLKKLYSPYIE